jgi:hypothetical protein
LDRRRISEQLLTLHGEKHHESNRSHTTLKTVKLRYLWSSCVTWMGELKAAYTIFVRKRLGEPMEMGG